MSITYAAPSVNRSRIFRCSNWSCECSHRRFSAHSVDARGQMYPMHTISSTRMYDRSECTGCASMIAEARAKGVRLPKTPYNSGSFTASSEWRR